MIAAQVAVAAGPDLEPVADGNVEQPDRREGLGSAWGLFFLYFQKQTDVNLRLRSNLFKDCLGPYWSEVLAAAYVHSLDAVFFLIFKGPS
jgi:hypothetical protein